MVTARAYYGGDPDVTDSYPGRTYTLGIAEGMVNGRYYKYVDAEDAGHYGFAPGDVFQHTEPKTKDITLNDARPFEH